MQINEDDSLPKTICRMCIQIIQTFDKFCNEVSQHQQLLQLSKLKNACTETQILTTREGTIIITLQTTPNSDGMVNTNPTTDNIIVSKLINDETNEPNETDISTRYDKVKNDEISNYILSTVSSKPTQIITTDSIERELDNLNSNEITLTEIHDGVGDSDNEDQYNEDENAIDHDDVVNTDLQKEKFKDFPTKFIEDAKLLYKGRDLLEMISKFYQLECDQCR